MPLYEFHCPTCGQSLDFLDRNHAGDPCPTLLRGDFTKRDGTRTTEYKCSGVLKRRFSFAIKPTLPDHFNTATGSYVRNEAHLRSEFARRSDEATEYTGIQHDFQPIDMRDKEACGVTDEGLDATHDRAVAEGRPALDPSTLR